MKKWLVTLLLLIVTTLTAFKADGQTYTQSFIDKCTGEKKIATTTMINGSATVSFYNEVRTFTPLEVQTGQLQIWINQVYLKYSTLACPTNVVVQQTVANTVTQAASNAASQAASSAASAAASSSASAAASSSASTAASSSASSAASSSASSAGSSAASSGASASTSSTPPASSSSSSTQSGGSSSSSSSQSSGSSSSSETKTETKSESSSSSSSESKSESKTESKSESKSEEKKSESKSEEKKSDEKKEEKKSDEKKEEKKEEKKKGGNLNPTLVASDYTVAESADKGFGSILGLGWSRASMAGDEMFSANAMIWSNLKQFALGGGYTKMEFNEGKLDAIHSYGVTAAYLDGNYMGLLGYTWIKPHPKFGTYGYNVGIVNLLLKNADDKFDYSIITSSVAFWTKPFQYSKKLTISPQVFVMTSPISYNSVTGNTMVNRHAGFLLGSSFDYKLSRRFGFSFNYKFSGSTQPGTPILHNFLIGSRMVL